MTTTDETPMKILYGDGVHDDTAAMQDLVDGKPVLMRHPSNCYGLISSALLREIEGEQ